MKSHHFLDLFNTVWFLVVIAVIVGMITKPVIYDYVSFALKLGTSLFLIYKFNDFRSLRAFTELDKRICFMAGTNLFLITCNDYITEYLAIIKEYYEEIKQYFKK